MGPPDVYRPPGDLAPADLLVLLYTPHFFGDGFEQTLDLSERLGVPVRCRFTRDRRRMGDADAVLFHLPHLGELPTGSRRKPWVLMSMESEASQPALADPDFLRRFDLTASYRLDSDVPALYLNADEYRDFAPEPLPFSQRCATPLLFVASNPVPERNAFVAELMRHIAVDAPGRCLQNLTIEGFAEGGATAATTLMARYPFTLALENARCLDYVTEKLFRPLMVGSVPVYRGAPNVRDLLPAPDAAILVDDWESPRALAAHLRMLTVDEAAYAEHMAWRRRPRSAGFERLLAVGSIEARVRLAVKLAHGCDRTCGCGGRLRAPG